uniref:Uncharacterized protein n=1 Tax=viral metagenome TaxID=1070528 RepID=A0A6H1ZES4_9ZZZZ
MNDMMTTEQAADELGLTKRVVDNLTKRFPHLAPAREFGGLPVWTAADVSAVREHRRRTANGLCWRCGTDLAEPPSVQEEG